jgi:hypothetical protein
MCSTIAIHARALAPPPSTSFSMLPARRSVSIGSTRSTRTITRPARPATSVSVTSVPSRTITTRSTTCDLELADRRAAGLGGDMSAKVVDREVVEAILGGEDDRDRLAGLDLDLLRLESERPARHRDVASIVGNTTRDIVTSADLSSGHAPRLDDDPEPVVSRP